MQTCSCPCFSMNSCCFFRLSSIALPIKPPMVNHCAWLAALSCKLKHKDNYLILESCPLSDLGKVETKNKTKKHLCLRLLKLMKGNIREKNRRDWNGVRVHANVCVRAYYVCMCVCERYDNLDTALCLCLSVCLSHIIIFLLLNGLRWRTSVSVTVSI